MLTSITAVTVPRFWFGPPTLLNVGLVVRQVEGGYPEDLPPFDPEDENTIYHAANVEQKQNPSAGVYCACAKNALFTRTIEHARILISGTPPAHPGDPLPDPTHPPRYKETTHEVAKYNIEAGGPMDPSDEEVQSGNYTERFVTPSSLSSQYKFTVALDRPWRSVWGPGIRVPYRIVTETHTGTKTIDTDNSLPVGQTIPNSYDEEATVAYEAGETLIALEDGDTEGESDTLTLEPGEVGETKYIIGPPDTKYLRALFGVNTYGQRRRKMGFAPYVRDAATAGAVVACYSTETASTVPAEPGSPPNPVYSGSHTVVPQDSTVPGNPPTAKYTTTMSATVSPDYFSPLAGVVDGGVVGSGPVDAIDPGLIAREAVQVISSTQIVWPQGLKMTLSGGPVDTATITGPLAAAVAGYQWKSTDQEHLTDGGMVAVRYLPPNQLAYREQKGRYRVRLTPDFYGGIGTFFPEADPPQDPPLPPGDASLDLSWSVVSQNLDEGGETTTQQTATLDYSDDEDDDGDEDDPPRGVTQWYEAPVPSGNVLVRLDDLKVSGPTSADSLRQALVGYVDTGD